MPPKGSTTRRTRVHVKDKEFTLYVKTRDLFTVLAPTGRYTEGLLGIIVQDFLQKPDFMAMDLSRLDAVSLPLVRALCEYASGIDPASGRLVLVNPPEKIRGLVKLVDPQGKIKFILSDGYLEGGLSEVEERMRRSEDRVYLVRTMLASHPCWQLVDPESRWLCPFCVTIRPDVRFVARGSPTQVVVDRVLRHLIDECKTYTEGATDGWPFEVLERVIQGLHSEISSQGPAEAPRRAPAKATAAQDAETQRRHRLLPAAPPSVEGCEVEIYYRPATPPGGEFYDFVRLPEGRLGIIVGDVSGAGVDPGVLMGVARKVLCIRVREIPDLAQAVALANDDLCEELDGESYVTAVVVVVDGTRREMWLARAGHVSPFLARAGSPPEVTRLESPGPLLGLVPTASFEGGVEVQRHSLQPGDVLLLHTDGLEELKDASGEKFGADRIAAVLRAHAGHPANLILGAVILEGEQFAASSRRRDDVAAICVKVR